MSETSEAMAYITEAPTVQEGLKRLLAAAGLTDGDAVIVDSTQAPGVRAVPLPVIPPSSYRPLIAGGSDPEGVIAVDFANPRVVADSTCAKFQVPDGNGATTDITLVVPDDHIGPVQLTSEDPHQAFSMSHLQPGQSETFSFLIARNMWMAV